MKEKILYAVWAGMGILCAGLGFIENPQGAGKAVLVILALMCFVPGAMLLHHGYQTRDRKALHRVSIVAGCSLGLTLMALVLNFFSVLWSESAGTTLYEILVIVSTPMVCSQCWVLSLFLWACLLLTGLSLAKKLK